MYLPGFPTPVPGGTGGPQVYPQVQPPRNSLDPPTPAEMADNYSYLSDWNAAISQAQAATGCAGDTSIQAHLAMDGPNAVPPVSSYRSAAAPTSIPTQNGQGYTPDQLQQIADAPKISHAGEYKTGACSASDSNANICPPNASAPGWGNTGVSFPGPKPCSTGIIGWVSENPWLFVGLVVVGGFALDSLMSEQ